MHRATVMPSRKVAYHDENETVQMRLYKSLKVWSLYADLEECYGTFKVKYTFMPISIMFREISGVLLDNLFLFLRLVKQFMIRLLI